MESKPLDLTKDEVKGLRKILMDQDDDFEEIMDRYELTPKDKRALNVLRSLKKKVKEISNLWEKN